MNLNYHIYYGNKKVFFSIPRGILHACLLYTSDAADDIGPV